ncbi:MAG TPA: GNAT family N-acetyltransferase [Anaeromyxobacteraceae bacterium]|jgi:CelD/BcsL family acetyltransferase involved in cellulose biosynthesis|nr:GNAT family N-acetyltransferase [Anaeromyxobacteraceae bacterium]
MSLYLRVAESEDPGRLAALRSEWGELFDAAGQPNPFLSWEWLFSFWRAFGQRRRLRILEARGPGARLDGVLVLQGRRAVIGPRHYTLLGNGVAGADGLDVLARPGTEAQVRSAVASHLARTLPAWDVLDLEDLPSGSATAAALARALAPLGVEVELTPRFTCPGFVPRGTFAEHLRRIARRETFGRRCRWLARQRGFRIEVATAVGEMAEAIEDFLRLHRLRWAPEGGSYGIPPGRVEDFHRAVAPLLAARGFMRLYRLFVGGRSVAAVYGLELGGRFYYYQSGMDPEWAARSPGMVLTGRTVEDAYARGLSFYDFLRGTEPYKLEWAAEGRETVALRLRSPGLRAEALQAAEGAFRAARGAARAVAPERLWLALRRARRNLLLGAMGGIEGQ